KKSTVITATKSPTKKATETQAQAKTAPSNPVSNPSNPTANPKTPDGTGQIVNAALTTTAPPPANGPALGLRYTVLKKGPGGMVEVSPDSVFHAGDQIQVSVQTNYPGYLYIVNQGSSGAWQALFPSKEIQEGDNSVERLHTYTLPSAKHMMTITEPKGVE